MNEQTTKAARQLAEEDTRSEPLGNSSWGSELTVSLQILRCTSMIYEPTPPLNVYLEHALKVCYLPLP